MGNLVFQATLGGQVNLVGPNTASTYNINVPTVNGNMVTTGDTGTVTNTMLAGSIANAKLTNSSVTIGGTSIALGASSSTITNDLSISGLTVGKGAGAVSTNTAVGASALAANTTGVFNTALGYQALQTATADANTAIGRLALQATTSGAHNTMVGQGTAYQNTTGASLVGVGSGALDGNTTGSFNVAVGRQSLYSNTTASYNTAVGYQAGYSNTTAERNVSLGYQAGYAATTNGYSTFLGTYSGLGTTGQRNTFIGEGSGYLVTSGAQNSILGRFNGNQGGLDIRTASNIIVLSDGDGNPRFLVDSNGNFSNGAYGLSGAAYAFSVKTTGASGFLNWYIGSNQALFAYSGGSISSGASGANTILGLAKDSSTSRSLNAAGTLNASGADYAEYMTKAGDFTVAKGDVVGINADGKLTNVFADAVSFVVKSTDPSYVGGDTWFTEQVPKDETNSPKQAGDAEYDAWVARLEDARATVDRIAFAGQVPVNVTGATAGQYIVPVNDNGAIKGEAVSNPTFEQYQQSVGKVIAIEQDGRARIIVKVA